jgi:hypothetical protein
MEPVSLPKACRDSGEKRDFEALEAILGSRAGRFEGLNGGS